MHFATIMLLLFLGPWCFRKKKQRRFFRAQDLKQKMDPQAHLKSKGQSLGNPRDLTAAHFWGLKNRRMTGG